MASSLTKRLAALFGASCAALLLAVPVAAPGHADRAVLESPAAACQAVDDPGDIPFDKRYYTQSPLVQFCSTAGFLSKNSTLAFTPFA
ncbi:hypothetical protein ACFWUP_02330 [Nocardia sp. NPDC058658]|uniref:hypothetical protein n=1 Tax=Nocardia sp. NPDC058658 TaxID=3346580 RepID=UPI0036610118